MESELSGTRQDSPGPSLSSSTGGAVLDKCDVVSSPLLHGQSSSSFSAPLPSPINNGQQWPSSWNESALEAVRVECIRSKFVTKGLSESAIQSLMLKYITKSATSKNYLKYQYMFIEWCSQQHITVSTFTSAHLINFLSHVKELYHWQPSTLKLVRSAITHLNAHPNTISKCNLINGFVSSLVQQQDPVRIHRKKISLQPAICYAKSIPSSITTPWSVLQSKLAFLLGVTTFMRPSDLARISLESCQISGSHLFFQVVAPKETRQRRRIIQDYTVRSHTDPDPCPVHLFQILQAHPIWRSVADRSTALFFSDRGAPLSSGTLSKWLHRRFISKVTSEPTTLRSLASSAALDAGISKDDIIALGSWSNSYVFDNHYRRNHMLSVDFTSTLLTSPAGTNIPTSGLDSSNVELPVVNESDDDGDDDDLYMDAMDSLDEQQ
ncbi:hypothetical protein G6F37_012111 [Rhizopus arrhizus]|nr:hypothetical protein G6F37_012111 [Rhizopus arrhizus]